MNRRTFIKTSLTVTGSLLVKFSTHAEDKDSSIDSTEVTFPPLGFIEITTDNQISLKLTKLEMGQGVGTSYLAIVAEELDVVTSDIQIIKPQYNNTNKELYHKINWAITGGSSSIRSGWQPLREAAATTKQLLLQAAANYWNISIKNCKALDGKITNTKNNKSFLYGDLIELAVILPIPTKVKLKEYSEFRFIGKQQKSYMHNNMCMGKQQYGIDHVLPAMLYASIKHCPTITGVVKSFNKSEILSIEGVIDVIVIPRAQLIKNADKGDPLDDASIREGIAVIASSTWPALKAVKKLDVIWQHNIEKHNNKSLKEKCLTMLENRGKSLITHGEVLKYFEQADSVFSAIYHCPYVSHHYIEPLNAIAQVEDNTCEVWAGTQSPERDRVAISKALNIDIDDISINVQSTGGAFGRKYNPDFTVEAAYIAKQTKRPIRLLWSREEEISCGQQSDYEVQKFSVSLNQHKEITAYQWQSIISGKWVSEINLYLIHIPHFDLSFQRRDKTLNLAPWRAVQTARTNLGVECFVDELAYLVKQNPLDYRLSLLASAVQLPNLTKNNLWVLEHATKYRNKYNTLLQTVKNKGIIKPSRKNGRGQGIALGYYGGSTLIQVVDMSVVENTCIIHRITSIIDCGIVVDLNGAEQQISGSIIWTLNTLFMPSTQFKNSQITQSNFHDSPLITMPQIPKFDIEFINSNEAPTGLGEPAVCSLAPAVLNAFFAATGVRIRERQLANFTLEAK